jgi:signal peptidase II
MSRLAINRPYVALTALVVVGDQLTKNWAVTHLSDGHADHVAWTLQFNLGFNSGMAFSQGTSFGPLIAVLAFVAMVFLAATLRRSQSLTTSLGVALVLGGALGNFIDRLFRGDAWLRGKVVDFIDFQWFPVFNVADSAITVGGTLLVLSALFARDQAPT